ncbi:MAG: hypothetical protein CL840_12945 [Crocinitomicaceae bacterium]|nr:hypothetical protein [Crocinitomicaceae bacterium]|tara:strand:+ start:2507 stop:2899 length:393 start_codon:yes stop_codon:yes gene_type:complete
METKKTFKKIEGANLLRGFARYGLLAIGLVTFLFSLVSGSEAYGGGISGIVQNSPNAIPWIALLIALFVAWKNELLGGSIILLLGITLVARSNFGGPNFFVVTFILTSLISLLGAFFLGSWYLRKNQLVK